MEIEQIWKTNDGLIAVIGIIPHIGNRKYKSHRVAYVGVNEINPFWRIDNQSFKVHGGITYTGYNDKINLGSLKLWWWGFDALHSNDGFIEDDPDNPSPLSDIFTGTVKTRAYMQQQCEDLSRQLS